MIGRLAVLIAAAALPCGAAFAQAAAPDPAALDLARLLMARDETLYDDGDTSRIQARIENQLLASEGACNPFQSECRGAATQVAREFAPAFRQSERARSEQITALLIADHLSGEELTRTLQYLRGDDGGRLLGLLTMLRDPELTQRRRRELERGVERTTPDAMVAARAQFRRLTRNLRPAPR